MKQSLTELQEHVVDVFKELGKKGDAKDAKRAWRAGREIILHVPNKMSQTKIHNLEALIALANLQSTRNI